MGDSERVLVLIRRESPADHDTVRSLITRAFAGRPFSNGSEPRIVDGLRRADALVLSLVAVRGSEVVGHVAFSAVGPPALHGWYALGPVSVEPSFQRRGVGTQLIEAGLRDLRSRGAKGCVVVGDHRYYQRFGFSLVPELAPPGCSAEHFQLNAFGPSRPTARVAFHAAFSVGPS